MTGIRLGMGDESSPPLDESATMVAQQQNVKCRRCMSWQNRIRSFPMTNLSNMPYGIQVGRFQEVASLLGPRDVVAFKEEGGPLIGRVLEAILSQRNRKQKLGKHIILYKGDLGW